LDDGIGDTLVLIDKLNGIGNAEDFEMRAKEVALPSTGSTTFLSILSG
jgi:hypothetical protein